MQDMKEQKKKSIKFVNKANPKLKISMTSGWRSAFKKMGS